MSNQVDRTWSTALPRLLALLVTPVGMLQRRRRGSVRRLRYGPRQLTTPGRYSVSLLASFAAWPAIGRPLPSPSSSRLCWAS